MSATHHPITAAEAKRLLAGFKAAPALVLAVSGGPDSVALLWLAARWRRGLKQGPKLIAVTVDHGLRAEAAREARAVKRLAARLDLPHRTKRWLGPKPETGVPAAAREARYRLLAEAAHAERATHVLTAHTRDDQAETVLMRMSKGSGIAGLAAMARHTPREGLILSRPFLDVPKARLVATLKAAAIDFADDPSNANPAYTRPRLRALMPALASEGCDARNLSRLAARMARADAALERFADGAEGYLALHAPNQPGLDAAYFAGLPEEIRIRLLQRAINRVGHEGPAELGKVETLATALDSAFEARKAGQGVLLKQTLAGALIVLSGDRLEVRPAPRRRKPA